MKNQYHIQTYWPQWEGKDQLTFKGGCLPNNAVMYSPQYWVQYRYAKDAYGYADACPAKDLLYSSFDINWAVDEKGDPVALDQACVDIINHQKVTAKNDPTDLLKRIDKQHGTHTIDWAEKIGLGSKKYTIVNIDK